MNQSQTNMTPSNTTSIDQLNSFLRGEISAVETYQQAQESAKSAHVRDQISHCRQSHEQRVELLKKWILGLGGTPAEGSGTWGAFAKLVEGGAAVFGESTAIAALEEGEDHGLKDYRTDLSNLDFETRKFVETQLLAAQNETHRAMHNLKHQLASAS